MLQTKSRNIDGMIKVKPGYTYFSADGNFVVTLKTKATIQYDGLIIWEPPVIYKSACIIDVEYFPFDLQTCKMKFGTWTYDGNQIDLIHICAENESSSTFIGNGISFVDFYPNVEWDVLQGNAFKNYKRYPCCPEPYIDVTFELTIRRKTLFHTVNLILPCVAISFLTVIVFYLPSDSGEKITLCISILLSLTVFFLLLAEIIPPTSIVIPLIGKYLLFTMTAVTLSIVATIVTIRIHFHSKSTHKMSNWVRCLFLVILPKILLMTRPKQEPRMSTKHSTAQCNGYNNGKDNAASNDLLLDEDRSHEGSGVESGVDVETTTFQNPPKRKSSHLEKLDFIVEHLKRQDRDRSVSIFEKYQTLQFS